MLPEFCNVLRITALNFGEINRGRNAHRRPRVAASTTNMVIVVMRGGKGLGGGSEESTLPGEQPGGNDTNSVTSLQIL